MKLSPILSNFIVISLYFHAYSSIRCILNDIMCRHYSLVSDDLLCGADNERSICIYFLLNSFEFVRLGCG